MLTPWKPSSPNRTAYRSPRLVMEPPAPPPSASRDTSGITSVLAPAMAPRSTSGMPLYRVAGAAE